MPIQVRGLTAYPLSAASARVRVGDFRPFLQAQGIELTHRPALRDAEYAVLKSNANPAHKVAILARSALRTARDQQTEGLLLVQRLLLLTPFPGVDPPRHVDAYDIDDALFVGSPADTNKRYQWVKRERQRAVATMRRARLVIAGNPYLAEHARTLNRRVEVVPSCVDPERQPLRQHAGADVVKIGWIGSHTTVAYLRPVLPVIARLNSHGHRAMLVVIGGDTGVRADWIEHRPWSLERQAADLAGFDIGIMPLPDTDWARGKSGYKLLQYFAAGVPGVASSVGSTPNWSPTAAGSPSPLDTEWEQGLRALIVNADERRSRGLAARAYVEANYSYQRWAPGARGAAALAGQLMPTTKPCAADPDINAGPAMRALVSCAEHTAVRRPCAAHWEALVALDFPPDEYEVVVVDDGSADSTGDVVRSFTDRSPRVRYVEQPELGCGHGRSQQRRRRRRGRAPDLPRRRHPRAARPRPRAHLAVREAYGDCLVNGHWELHPQDASDAGGDAIRSLPDRSRETGQGRQ